MLQEEKEVFECPICFKTYNAFYTLKNHIAKSHKNNSCPVCKKNYRSLITHLFNKSKECEKHRMYYGLFSNRARRNRANKKDAEYFAFELTKKVER